MFIREIQCQYKEESKLGECFAWKVAKTKIGIMVSKDGEVEYLSKEIEPPEKSPEVRLSR